MATHEIKTWPNEFQAIVEGRKPFEWRKDDRGFEVGDTLRLLEWLPHAPTTGDEGCLAAAYYTGREIAVTVTDIQRGPSWGIPEGFCMMSIQPLTRYADVNAKAERFMSQSQAVSGLLVDVIDHSIKRCFAADQAHLMPRKPDVLRLVAASLMLAKFYGYDLGATIKGWDEWDWQYLGHCNICGQDHDREAGCPPQEPRNKRGGEPGCQ